MPARAGQPSAVSASRIPSPAHTTRHKMSVKPGPGGVDRGVEPPLRVDLAAAEIGPAADPLRPRATGAASQVIVTRGESWARSQSHRNRSPASNWRWLTSPRAFSQPSGDFGAD